MSRELAGKVVLVTGAGSGIGRETAIAFASAGADLELLDIDPAGLERTALLCRLIGRAVHLHVADVADAQAMEGVAAAVHERAPALDVLVNNAGVGVVGSFVDTDLATWRWALGINVMGVVHGCHFFLPAMIARGAGHIVNVASAAGLAAPKLLSTYAATKFAVVGLSEVLRAELEPQGIGVSTICPGVIDTAIVHASRRTGTLAEDDRFQGRIIDIYKWRNFGPERVARAILDAVNKRRGVVPVAPEAWALYGLKRFVPSLLHAFFTRMPDL